MTFGLSATQMLRAFIFYKNKLRYRTPAVDRKTLLSAFSNSNQQTRDRDAQQQGFRQKQIGHVLGQRTRGKDDGFLPLFYHERMRCST